MGSSHYIQETMQKEFAGAKDESYEYGRLYRSRLVEWRKEPLTVVRVEHPTNLPRARTLGFKAKQGFVVARVRVRRGGGMFSRPVRGRRPKRMGVSKLTRRISIQTIAEQKAGRRFPNLEVLNSYWVGEDGRHKYFEVILVDPSHAVIASDKNVQWVLKKHHRGRAFRGLTSSGKRSRGLHKKGRGTEKVRPSQRANLRKAR